MFDKAGFFLFQDKVEAVQGFKRSERFGVDVVQPVIIEIAGARAFELLVEQPLPVLFFFEHIGRELCCEGKAVSRVAVDKHPFCRFLALPVAVHPCGVEIRESTCQEGIDHFFQQRIVDAACILCIQQRQPHQPETEFPVAHDVFSFQICFVLRCVLSCYIEAASSCLVYSSFGWL